jgi:murein tripeptide amidase MpaA
VNVESIGKTFERRDMQLITVTSNQNSNSAMMVTGAHHSRELSSIQLPLLGILNILHRYVQNKPGDQVFELLKNHKLYVVPVVNIDGFNLISEYLERDGKFEFKRKNMNNASFS